jgi:hypothetical protein
MPTALKRIMPPNKQSRPFVRTHGRRRKSGDVHTIASFCASNAISESKYFDLKRRGKGPREIELNKRILITPEAEADWRRDREAETLAERTAGGRRGSAA